MKGLRIACGLLALSAAFSLGMLTGQATLSPPAAASDAPILVLPTADAVLLEVPPLCQHPEFSTGCEVVTATMALRYVGVEVTVDDLADRLPLSRDWYWHEGQFYGPDPNAHFCGDPRSEQSYGCFAPVIEKVTAACLDDPARVVNATGLTLPTLCLQYVDKGIPVMVWATIGMAPIESGRSWILPDGSEFTWPAGEHCLLLVGYDSENYYFNDPAEGRRAVYPKQIAESRYEALGRQALAVI